MEYAQQSHAESKHTETSASACSCCFPIVASPPSPLVCVESFGRVLWIAVLAPCLVKLQPLFRTKKVESSKQAGNSNVLEQEFIVNWRVFHEKVVPCLGRLPFWFWEVASWPWKCAVRRGRNTTQLHRLSIYNKPIQGSRHESSSLMECQVRVLGIFTYIVCLIQFYIFKYEHRYVSAKCS